MHKKLYFALAMALSTPACLNAADFPKFEDVVIEQDLPVYSLQFENTSGLSDEQALTDLVDVFMGNPYYAGKKLLITVGSAYGEVTRSKDHMSLQRETMGEKTVIKPSQWAVDAGALVAGATGGLSGKGTAAVDVTHKAKDGSETTVKVVITVEASKGAGAAKKPNN